MKQIICLKEKENTNPNYVTAREFLEWAKEDLKEESKRALGNALGNIKKAFHARIDEIISRTNVLHGNNGSSIRNTPEKLEILKRLEMPFRTITQNITNERNTFEHDYILPDKNIVWGYHETAMLWLKSSYNDYDFEKVALVINPKGNKPVFDENMNIINKCNFDFYWNTKKEIHEFKKGKFQTHKFSDYTWEDLLKFQKASIIRQYDSAPLMTLDQRAITNLYKKLLKFNQKK